MTAVCALVDGVAPVEFRWFHEGRLIRSGTRVQLRQLADLSVLQIQKVIEADRGKYECEVEDVRNSRDRHAAELTVLGKLTKMNYELH